MPGLDLSDLGGVRENYDLSDIGGVPDKPTATQPVSSKSYDLSDIGGVPETSAERETADLARYKSMPDLPTGTLRNFWDILTQPRTAAEMGQEITQAANTSPLDALPQPSQEPGAFNAANRLAYEALRTGTTPFAAATAGIAPKVLGATGLVGGAVNAATRGGLLAEGTKEAAQAAGQRFSNTDLTPEQKAALDVQMGTGGLMALAPAAPFHEAAPSGLDANAIETAPALAPEQPESAPETPQEQTPPVQIAATPPNASPAPASALPATVKATVMPDAVPVVETDVQAEAPSPAAENPPEAQPSPAPATATPTPEAMRLNQLNAIPEGDRTLEENAEQNALQVKSDTANSPNNPGWNDLKGFIAGTSVDKWADTILKGGAAHSGPEVLAAYAVRGAATIERGIIKVAAWTKEMVNQGMPRDIAPRVWVASNQLLKRGRKTQVKNLVNFVSGVDPETAVKEMTQRDVAAIQQKSSAQAFKAGTKAGASKVKNAPENLTLKGQITKSAELQSPVEVRTKAQAIQDQIAQSMSKRDAMREYYAGQERASAQAAEAVLKDAKQADKWSMADSKNVRNSLLDLVEKSLPVSERGKFTRQITAATERPPLLSEKGGEMYEKAAKVAANIVNRAEEVHRENVIGEIKKTVERATESPSVDVGYKAKISQAIKRLSYSRLSGQKEAWLKGVRDYVAQAGEQSTVPDSILNQINLLNKTPARDMPVNVLEAIRDRVALLEKLGRTKFSARQQLYENEQTAVMGDMMSSKGTVLNDLPEKRSPGVKLSLPQRVNQAVGNKIRAALSWGARVGHTLLTRDVMLDMLDGNSNYKGALNRLVGGRIDADYNSEMNLREKLQEPFKAIARTLGNYSKLELERISIHAIAQEEGGIQRLKDSGVSSATIQRVVGHLTPKEMAYYKTARRVFDESVLPALTKFMHELYNIEVKPVQNYWPFQRDNTLIEADKTAQPNKADAAKGDEVKFDELAAWRQLENDFLPRRSTKTERGFTIERVVNARGAVRLDASNVVNRHLNDFAHLISTQRNLKMLGEIVRKDAFALKYGLLGRDYTLNLLDTIARNSSPVGSYRVKWMDTMNRNASVGILGLRLLSQLKHLPNIAFSVAHVRPDFLIKGMTHAMTPEGSAFIKKNFAEVSHRFGGEVGLQDLMEGNLLRRTQAGAFMLERALDAAIARGTVLGRYMQEMGNRGVDDIYNSAVDQEAQRMAFLIARQSVTSPLLKDVPTSLSRGQLLGSNMSLSRALFQFQTTMMRQWSFLRHDIFDLGIRNMDPKKFTVASLAFLAMLYGESKIVQASSSFIHGKKEEDEGPVHQIATEGMKRVPFAGNLESMGQYGETGIPMADAALSVAKDAYQLEQNKNDFGGKLSPRAAAKAKAQLMGLAGEVAGVPGAATAEQWYEGHDLPPSKKR